MKMVMMDCSPDVNGPLGAIAGVTSSTVIALATAGHSDTAAAAAAAAGAARRRLLRLYGWDWLQVCGRVLG